MSAVKRIFLFILTNIAVVVVLSIIVSLFHIEPYLTPYGLNLVALAEISLIIGFVGAFISLLMSKFVAKWTMRVRVIKTPQHPLEVRLVQVITRIAKQKGIKTPEIGIYPSTEVNAFATGATRNSSLVAVSAGLLEAMSEEELEGVLAHEMSHVANGDMVTMTLIQGVLNAFVIFASRALAYVIQNAMGRDSKAVGGLIYFFISIVLQIVFGMLASMIVFWFSRKREFRADAGAADSIGKAKMIAALEKLKTLGNRIDTTQPALATMKITDKPSRFSGIFSTHPSLDERIQALKHNK